MMDRRAFLLEAAAGAAVSSLPHRRAGAAAAEAERKAIYAEVDKRAGEAVDRLKEWIPQPSINSQSVGMKEGAELMMRLARDAGFQKVYTFATAN